MASTTGSARAPGGRSQSPAGSSTHSWSMLSGSVASASHSTCSSRATASQYRRFGSDVVVIRDRPARSLEESVDGDLLESAPAPSIQHNPGHNPDAERAARKPSSPTETPGCAARGRSSGHSRPLAQPLGSRLRTGEQDPEGACAQFSRCMLTLELSGPEAPWGHDWPWVAILVSSALLTPYVAGSMGRSLKTSRTQGADVYAHQDQEPAKDQAQGDRLVVEPYGPQNSQERDDHEPVRGARRRPVTGGPRGRAGTPRLSRSPRDSRSPATSRCAVGARTGRQQSWTR